MDEFRCGGSGTCPPQVYTIVSGSCRAGGGGDFARLTSPNPSGSCAFM